LKASTHTEIYRPFDGEIRERALRFVPIALSGIRVGFKKKLPLLLLFGPLAITCIVYCVMVNVRFTLESGQALEGQRLQAQMMAAAMETLLAVSKLIVDFMQRAQFFALLAITWYGGGLIAEDRRLGAHLLYFSRPITRTDYVLGKLGVCFWFGALAVVYPVIVINLVAAFSSPDWSYVTGEGDVIWKSILFALFWVLAVASLVLCVSSLVARKTFALVSVFGIVMLVEAVANVAAEITDDAHFRIASLFTNFAHLANYLFDRELVQPWNPLLSLALIVAGIAGALTVVWLRVRRLEVVG